MISFKEFSGKREYFKICEYNNYINPTISKMVTSDNIVIGYYAYNENNKILGYIECPQDINVLSTKKESVDTFCFVIGFYLNPENSVKTNKKVLNTLIDLIEKYFALYDIIISFDDKIVNDNSKWMKENIIDLLLNHQYEKRKIIDSDNNVFVSFISYFNIRNKNFTCVESKFNDSIELVQ